MTEPKTLLIGLPDGGAGLIFPDHPAHHNRDGTIEVTFSAETLAALIEVAGYAVLIDRRLTRHAPDQEGQE